MNKYLAAHETHKAEARVAFALLNSYYAWPIPRVPGMDTVIRLSWRIKNGASVEEAAAKEYVYRWHLAVLPADQAVGDFNVINPPVSIFGTPHTIGM